MNACVTLRENSSAKCLDTYLNNRKVNVMVGQKEKKDEHEIQ